MTMKTTTLTPEQLSKYGLDNINCEFYRNITQQGIDSLFERTNFLDGEEDDNGVITMYCCRVTYVFVPIKRQIRMVEVLLGGVVCNNINVLL